MVLLVRLDLLYYKKLHNKHAWHCCIQLQHGVLWRPTGYPPLSHQLNTLYLNSPLTVVAPMVSTFWCDKLVKVPYSTKNLVEKPSSTNEGLSSRWVYRTLTTRTLYIEFILFISLAGTPA